MTTVSLCMIVRDCAEKLNSCLATIAPHVDELIVVNTALTSKEEGYLETNQVAEKWGAEVHHFPWTNNFSEARNYSYGQAESDVVMWLDSDDKVQNAEMMIRNVRRVFDEGGVDAISCEYLYEFDESGKCTTKLFRERFTRNGYFQWMEPIHECLVAQWEAKEARMPPDVGRIIHDKLKEDVEDSMAHSGRNLAIFEEYFGAKDKDEGYSPAGARMMFYWANTLMGVGRFDEAIAKYEEYISISGNPSEKHSAMISLSQAHRVLAQFDQSKHWALQAIGLDADLPSGYMHMAETAMVSNDFQAGIRFAKLAMAKKDGLEREMVSNPMGILHRPKFIMAYCYGHIGQNEEAKKWAQEAAPYYGDDENLRAMMDRITAHGRIQSELNCWARTRDSILAEGRLDDAITHAKNAPEMIRSEGEVQRIIPKLRPSGKPSVAFFCPGGPQEFWGPSSLVEGCGGSEEAVIHMSRLLAAKGWHVEVYAYTNEAGNQDGVHWYPWWHWSGEWDPGLDVAVWWRCPSGPVDYGRNARVNILWLHDIASKPQWTPKTEQLFDRIFFLSNYQRDLFDWVPSRKAFRTANGIADEHLVPIEKLDNQPDRFIWTSCPSRGLQNLLPLWPRIREKLPNAELDIFYGWTKIYMQHMRLAKGGIHKKIYDIVEEMKQFPGVNWHGRVGQREVNEAAAKAGIWLYPTEFPEISCITAMKMQAHGVTPVVANFGALKETVFSGVKMDGHMNTDPAAVTNLVDRAIQEALNPQDQESRREMAKEARRKFGWQGVADKWDLCFQDLLKEEADRPEGPLKVLRRGSQAILH